MPKIRGRRVALSRPRRWVVDLMVASRGMPIITFERRMNLAPLQAQRSGVPWSVLFAKAFALVAQNAPELRTCYQPWPWPHFYESDRSHASITIERDYAGERAVFIGRFDEPALQPLRQMQAKLDEWKQQPIESIAAFQRIIRYSAWPTLIRRGLWTYAGITGKQRVKNFGTFGISTTAGAGATALNLISPLPSTLNFSPFDASGHLDVRLHFDHRVYDGMTAARTLASLEETLHGPILAELR